MPAPLLRRRRQLALKVEEVEGTAETLTATNAYGLQPHDLVCTSDVEMEPNKPHGLSMSPHYATPGLRRSGATFMQRFRGSGTAGKAPKVHLPLLAAGYRVQRIVAANAVTSPVAHADNTSTGVTVATGGDGSYDGTGNRHWLVLITTGGASGAAQCSITDMSGQGGTTTGQTITTASAITVGNNATFTFTGASMSLTAGDKWFFSCYDTAAVVYTPTSGAAKNTSTGVAVTSAGTYSGTGDREWYVVVTTGGASAAAAVQAFDLLGNGTAVGSTTVTTASAITLGDSATITFTGAGMSLVVGDAWIVRCFDQDNNVHDPVDVGLVPSLTAGIYKDGVRNLVTGARNEFTIQATAGKPVTLASNFSGAYNAPTDTALLSGVVDYEKTEEAFLSASLVLGAYTSAIVTDLTITSGNVIAERTDASQASGIKAFSITDRTATLTINPEALLIANHDYYTAWTAGTPEFIYGRWGSAAGKKFELLGYAQYRSIGDDENNGRDIATITADLVRFSDTGDDELMIVHY